MDSACTVVLVATYRREAELRRLRACLERQAVPVHAWVVADNAGQDGVRAVVEGFPGSSGAPGTCLELPHNPGCGAGLAAAGREALRRFPALTHLWILDDDAVPPPDAHGLLLRALAASGAGLAAPLLADEKGGLWAFPEPEDRGQRHAIRRCATPGDAARILGHGPHPCRWATGACQLVDRRAVDTCGLPRPDFWMLGEDLEYSMRIGLRVGACFTTALTVPHLYPAPGPDDDSALLRAAHLRKIVSLLQNLTYLAFHGPRRMAMLRYLPGNYLRLFRTMGVSLLTLEMALGCLVGGALYARPSGSAVGQALRARIPPRL